nr:MAG TPA: hypothetical protein [Caudoviricetes sp.]
MSRAAINFLESNLLIYIDSRMNSVSTFNPDR